MAKLNPDDLVGVSETLLAPLRYRAAASRAGSAAFRDEAAERFHDAHDWEKQVVPTDKDGRSYCTAAAVTSTNPRLLLPFDASGVSIAAKSSDVLTHTGGYL